MEALALTVTLMVVGFASFYIQVSKHDPTAFNEVLNRTGALYFTMTTLATIGYGDIHARTDGARIAVMVQMLFNVVVIGASVKLILHTARRRSRDGAANHAGNHSRPIPPPERAAATMVVRWSGGVPELLVTLERSDREPLGQQIQRQLRDAVRTGRLAGGERLPSTRALAEQLGVSRGLIVSCYEQLESEGYLVPRAGSGSAVATGAADTASSAHAPPAARRSIDVDFEYGVPDLASFPRRDWAWALTHACRSASVADIGDEAAGGSAALRTVLALLPPAGAGGGRRRRTRGGRARLPPRVARGAPHPRRVRRHPRRSRGSRPDRQRRDRPGQRARAGPHPGRRRGPRRRGAVAFGGRRGAGDPGAPVPDRGGAVGPAAPGAGRVGARPAAAS